MILGADSRQNVADGLATTASATYEVNTLIGGCNASLRGGRAGEAAGRVFSL